jgi:hypothetical protein
MLLNYWCHKLFIRVTQYVYIYLSLIWFCNGKTLLSAAKYIFSVAPPSWVVEDVKKHLDRDGILSDLYCVLREGICPRSTNMTQYLVGFYTSSFKQLTCSFTGSESIRSRYRLCSFHTFFVWNYKWAQNTKTSQRVQQEPCHAVTQQIYSHTCPQLSGPRRRVWSDFAECGAVNYVQQTHKKSYQSNGIGSSEKNGFIVISRI